MRSSTAVEGGSVYLFTRTRTIRTARLSDAMGFAGEMTEFVRQSTGLPVACYSTVFGAPLGTLMWSTTVESQAQLGQVMMDLLSDEQYVRRVEEADELFTGPSNDSLARIVDITGEITEPPAVCAWTSANVALGHITKCMQWSIEMAHYVHGVTGNPGLFLNGVYGEFGNVGWLSGAADMEAVDAAGDKLAVDPGYVQRIEDAEDLFVPGSGRQGLLRRIA